MNRTFSWKLATIIKNADPERTHSVEVMYYALTILLNTLFIFGAVLVIGWTTDAFINTLITLATFTILRMTSGGLHLKKAWACNIVSISICTIIPHLPQIPLFYLVFINLISISLMFLYSPAPDRNALMPKKLYPFLKIISIAIIISFFFINPSILVLIGIIQSLSIIPYRREVLPL